MDNFVFHNPTTVLFGRSTVERLGDEAKKLGTRCLLVTGQQHARQTGLYDLAHDLLVDAGIDIMDLSGITPNPVLDHVRRGIRHVKENRLDFIVALGGGSVIDSAKAICAGAMVEHDVWKFFTGRKSIKAKLPLLCISTLSGSGSEMNGGMVLTNQETKQKFGTGNRILHPDTAILDPSLTFSVSPYLTASGTVDAILHILEFYCTCRDTHTMLQDELIEGLIRTLMKSCEQALEDPDNYEARANLMWASALALSGLPAAGLGRVGFPMHMIEHSLSALYNVPHGAGLAVIAPGWLSWQAEKRPERIAQFARKIFGVADNGSLFEQATTGILLLRRWFIEAGCPAKLADLDIPEKDIPDIAVNSLGLAALWRLNKEYDQQTVETILQACVG